LEGRGQPRPSFVLKPVLAAADTSDMSRISPKMRIAAGAGLALIVVAIAFKLLVHSAGADASAPVVIPHPATQPHVSSTGKKAPSHAVELRSSLPAPLRRALLRNRVVVAVLYAPDAPGDKDAVVEAGKGAHDAKVGFAILNIRDEAVARAVAHQVHGAYDPTVLVVRRHGTIVLELDGFADAGVVAQAATNARQ
jgi:hypothetical protein